MVVQLFSMQPVKTCHTVGMGGGMVRCGDIPHCTCTCVTCDTNTAVSPVTHDLPYQQIIPTNSNTSVFHMLLVPYSIAMDTLSLFQIIPLLSLYHFTV